MFDGMMANPVVQKLQAGITFTARRHEVIANNIANITTPGFKAKDLSEKNFISTLARIGDRIEDAMQVINSPDAGVPRPDGNNVNIEREMTKLSSNAIRHNILISLLSKQFRMLESALRERIV